MKTQFKTGTIFLVDFDPSIGHEYKKIRPAIIVQSEKTIKIGSLITVMPITSQTEKAQEEDVLLKKSSTNGLFADSIVKLACIHSFDEKRFLKKIGEGSDELMESIAHYLRLHFNL
jgi:mRNA interferase MazF